jgi:1-acyl-sn-glycerol-3-phosphate acyltransferase
MFYPLFIRVNGRTTIAPIDLPAPSEGTDPWSVEDLPAAGRPLLRDRVARLALRILLCAVFRIEMTGLERIPRGRPAIYVANHLSWLDPFLLLLLAPLAPRRFIIGDAAQTLKTGWRRAVIAPFRMFIPLERAHPQGALRAMERILEDGNSLLIFPEGQVGPEEGAVLPLQSGVAHLAAKTGYPVVTVGISGSKDLWLRKRLRVQVGAVIDPATPRAQTPRAARALLLEELRAVIAGSIRPLPEARGPRLFRHTLTTLL